MEKKTEFLKSAFSAKKRNKKNILLSVVALVLVLMTMVASTYAWIETTSSIQIYTTKSGQIDDRTNSVAKIYTTNEAHKGKEISLDNYFRASGNVHLAPALSPDGENFYFKKLRSGNSTVEYRKGNINDKNVNYISFSFKINAEDEDTEFYFNQIPTIKIGDEEHKDNLVRFAISAGGSTAIYSNKKEDNEEVTINGTKYTSNIRSFKDYTNKTATASLFKITKNTPAIVTITMWLNDTADAKYTGKAVTVSNFKLITNADKLTQIRFVDKTTNFNSGNNGGYGWTANNDAKMWIKYGNVTATMEKSTDSDGFTIWTYDVNSIGDTGDLYFYRTASNVTQSPESNYLQEWKTTLADRKTANSYEYTAYSAYNNKTGFGAWGKVVEYTLNTELSDVLQKPSQDKDATNVVMTVGEYTCNLSYKDGLWKGFVPDKGVQNVKFAFTNGSNNYNITTGTRPAADYNYTITSANTGYWGTPVTITLEYADKCYSDMGKISATGSKEGYTKVKVTKGTEVSFIAEDSDDYYFVSWHSEKVASNQNVVTNKVTANEDKTFYAKYEKKIEISVDYVTNCDNSMGSITFADGSTSVKVKKNQEVELKAVASSGHSFVSWYENKDGSGKISGNKVSSNVDKTYYAEFISKVTITVVAKDGNGTVSVSGGGKTGTSIEVDPNTPITFKQTSASGYEFVGWEDENGNSVTPPSTATQSKTYVAVFQKVTSKRLYFNIASVPWTDVCCYTYDGGSSMSWPGNRMTKLNNSGTIYYIDIDPAYQKIIFNGIDSSKNNDRKQTVTITASDSVNYYSLISTESLSGGNYLYESGVYPNT